MVLNTYYDWDGGGSAQDLLHQPVSVVQGFHDLPLVLGDLQRKKTLLASFRLSGYTATAHEHDNQLTAARSKAVSPKPREQPACEGETKGTHREGI